MKMLRSIRSILIVVTLSGALISAATQQSEEERLYQSGTQALDESRWTEAIPFFDKVIEQKGRRTDAALYWKAYALNKSGDKAAALESLRLLRQQFPQSSWQTDAGALEVEIRQQSGQTVSPADEPNEDLKILALQGLMRSAPERALPALERIAQSEGSPRLKKQALFILAQAGSLPQARDILVKLARNDSDPATQKAAIKALGALGSSENRKVLHELYSQTSSQSVKADILQGFMVAGETSFLLQAAEEETDPELVKTAIKLLGAAGGTSQLKELYGEKTDPEIRKAILNGLFIAGDRATLSDLANNEPDASLRSEAIEKLGLSGGVDELKALYDKEQDPSLKRQILKALFLAGARTEIRTLALSETSPELRREAIHFLGLMGPSTAEGLLQIYKDPGSDPETKQAVIQALFLQGNADALVQLARSESNPSMKASLVQKLSLMDSPAAKNYLIELLQQ